MSFDLALVNSDLSIRPDGAIRTVDRADKLKQDIIKIVLTPLGSVRFHPWYGCAINDNIIGETLPDNMLFQEIASALQQSLSRLQTLQRSQATGQRVTKSEIIGAIRDILVQRKVEDPRQVNVVVFAVSKDYNSVEEVFTIAP